MALLIDGHNLIAKLPGVSLADPNDEQQLIQQLRRYAWRKRKKITVVFDPGLVPGTGQPPAHSNVHVIYASLGQTADSVIIRKVRQHHNPHELVVISSDREVISAVRAAGARTISSRAFASELCTIIQPAPNDVEKPMSETGTVSPDEVEYWLHVFQDDK